MKSQRKWRKCLQQIRARVDAALESRNREKTVHVRLRIISSIRVTRFSGATDRSSRLNSSIARQRQIISRAGGSGVSRLPLRAAIACSFIDRT